MIHINFHNIYRTAVSNPFTSDETYVTIAASAKLQPYIRCFWGSSCSFNPHTSDIYRNTLIIPDTCFDLMLMKNHASGRYHIIFLGMSDTYVVDQWDERDQNLSLFAIRFNFWTMNLIGKRSMRDTLNQTLEPQEIFPDVEEFCQQIFEKDTFDDRMMLAQSYIEKLLDFSRLNPDFYNGAELMLKQKGRITLDQLSSHLGYSPRQTQRIFQDMTGASPKQMTNMIRYQSLWQEMLVSGTIDYQNMVYKYGYADQSHLIADFKKYHSMTPKEALKRIFK